MAQDPRFWTRERYEQTKWEMNVSSVCACENMQEKQVKMMMMSLVGLLRVYLEPSKNLTRFGAGRAPRRGVSRMIS